MILMNGNKPVLEFNLIDSYLRVLNNEFLPYALKDYIQTTNVHHFQKAIEDITLFRDWLSGRMLTLSRENAKVILNVLALPQTLTTAQRVEIVLKCKALSMTDNFWVKEEDEDLYFTDVCLRNIKLSDASYQIAVLGRHISVCLEDLKSDVLTNGMFTKTWKRTNEEVELWKTDKTIDNINTQSEIKVSQILDTTNIPHISYRKEIQDNLTFAVSKCFTNDDYSFVTAQEIKDYCIHTKKPFEDFINPFICNFANMTIFDYIVANTDRHSENWGFMINNKTNQIISFAPLFDHNQSLIADKFHTDINELIYEPTGKTFKESVENMIPYINFQIKESSLPDKCKERYSYVLQLQKEYNDIERE